jgi:hypothetical protein
VLVAHAQQLVSMPPLPSAGQAVNLQPPVAGKRQRARLQYLCADASAMCSPDGITAQIVFASPFYGKIYSQQYPMAHECVYYNSYDMNMILFTIPNFACGTQVLRNNANVRRARTRVCV